MVTDRRHRVFPYAVEDGGRHIAMDIAEISGLKLGEVYNVAGILESYGEIVPDWGLSEVLTDVSIEGVRYLTCAEWSKKYDLDTDELIELLEKESRDTAPDHQPSSLDH